MKTAVSIDKNGFWENWPRLYNFIQLLIDGNSYKKIVKRLPGYIKRESILDLGCGTSQIIPYLKPERYWGFDANEKYLEFAKKRFKNKSYVFKTEDLQYLKLPKQSFDLVFSMNVFHHLDNRSVASVLNKLKKWNKYKYLVVVDCHPVGVFKSIFTSLDAGSFPRELKQLDKLISRYFMIKKSVNFLNWSHTYQHRLYLIKGK